MLDFGIIDNTYDLYGDFEKRIEKLASHGYKYIDYSLFTNTKTDFFNTEDEIFFSEVEKQRKICEKYNVKVSQTHGPWRYPPEDSTKELRQLRFAEMAKAIKATALLNCKNIVIHGLMPFTTHDVGHEDETEKINLEFFKRLCDVAEEHGVFICLENMPMLYYTLNTPKRVLDFVKKVGHQNLKICLDTGHCSVFDASPADAVRLIGKDLLRCLHIHDNDGKKDKHQNPFYGVIDWLDFAAALKEIGFEGVLSLETPIPHTLPKELWETELLNLKSKIQYLAEKASN